MNRHISDVSPIMVILQWTMANVSWSDWNNDQHKSHHGRYSVMFHSER